LKALLAGGANINAVDDGFSALDYAASWEERKAPRLLIDHGANPDGGGHSGTTPLHTAQWLGDQDLVEYLLKKGANPSLLDSQGRTYLDIVQA
jgi:ankyrin repeat protein